MSFLSNNLGQTPTDQFSPTIQEMAENVKRLVWMIILIAVVAWLWMTFAH